MRHRPSHLKHALRSRAYNDLAQDAMRRRDWANAAFYTRRAQQCANESMTSKGTVKGEHKS